ncbi:MAG: hypothetical protein RBS40_09820 [Rhodocyclaceae bacterium]|nr:hypothetical protein [Rhodocyclaceae bacterium]
MNPSTNSASPPTLPGDHHRRRARRWLLALAVGLALSLALFGELTLLWPKVAALEGATFFTAAALLGAGLAIGPLLAATGLVMAVWHGVESVYRPRRTATPRTDKLIVAAGLLVWFGPSLALLAASGYAVATGRIHFSRPPRDYFLASDPIAFWQGVGFWLIIAAGLAFLAWRYWAPKLRPGTRADV